MATTVTRDQVLGGLLTALASLKPTTNTAVTTQKPLRDLARYTGEFSTEEALQRGIAGRTPAVLVAYQNERSIYTTVGRRVDRVEGTYFAICCTDAERNREDRRLLFAIMDLVRPLLAAHRLGLSIGPLRYAGDSLVRDDEKCLAYAMRFTTKYHVDYTKQAAYDSLLSTDGTLKFPASQGGATVESTHQTLLGP